MSTGGGTHDADAFGIDFPFGGAGAHGADGALGVFQHARMPVALRSEPITQDKGGDAILIQVERIILSFMAGQAAVAATGANHDGTTTGLVRRRQIHGESWNIIGSIAERAGSAGRPERESILGLGD